MNSGEKSIAGGGGELVTISSAVYDVLMETNEKSHYVQLFKTKQNKKKTTKDEAECGLLSLR